MAMEMTVDVVRRMCKEKDLYRTPHLNDKLYLHFMGFDRIANLDEYVNVKSIFLEGNALQSLDGLAPHCSQLRCIFAQQNCLLELTGLEGLENLDTLNVSNNAIKSLMGIQLLPRLTTLQITHNRLKMSEDLLALLDCPSLTVVDLSHNEIDDNDVGQKVLFKMPQLACLYLQGNPVVGTMRHYRKNMVVNIRTLNYLDDRPVFEKERRLCDAWQAGGIEAERQERASIKREEDEKDRENFEYLKMIREKAMAMKTGVRDKNGESDDNDDDDDDDSVSDDDDYVEPSEPPELVAARMKLASYPARAGEEEPADLTRARVQLHEQHTTPTPIVHEIIAGDDDDDEEVVAPPVLPSEETTAPPPDVMESVQDDDNDDLDVVASTTTNEESSIPPVDIDIEGDSEEIISASAIEIAVDDIHTPDLGTTTTTAADGAGDEDQDLPDLEDID